MPANMKMRESCLGSNLEPLSRKQLHNLRQSCVAPTVLAVLRRWYQLESEKFEEDDILREKMDKFLEELRETYGTKVVDTKNIYDPSYQVSVNVRLLFKIIDHMKRKGKKGSRVVDMPLRSAPDPIVPERSLDTASTQAAAFMLLSPLEIARQLTLMDFKAYSELKASELLNLCWSKYPDRAPNVKLLTRRFNEITIRLATLILSVPSLKERKALMERIIEVMYYLRVFNNFNGLMAAIAALGNSAVIRLKITISDMSRKAHDTLKSLRNVMSSSQNFTNYRAALTQATGAAVPFIGVHLTDLTFIDEGNPSKIGGLINFHKRRLTFTAIEETLHYQSKVLQLQPVEFIQDFLESLQKEKEQDLYTQSLCVEPRNCERKDLTP
mmetsp:Transcript_11453/g.32177  ORF Transcript_11453/g.32177 Transcript_11453/m.32177 type:complete len:383 (+) Transcript_11453:259-1407(+)